MNFSNLNPIILRRIIIDHYSDPTYKVAAFDDKKYSKKYLKSKSCIDEITIFILFEKDIIRDYRFSGVACSICIAASDIIGNIIINSTTAYAKRIIINFEKLILHKNGVNKDELFELVCMHSTYKLPARQKCALLTVRGILDIIEHRNC